ncbi:MAG: hypothetical protein E6Q97_05775 [Desulfurellales bacterium]|nr:MAG: hypothetical protein E6Q97_05775 [Desulfurellales bacterium]
MTDERCIDCGLHVFDCQCECESDDSVHEAEIARIDDARDARGETREQYNERRAVHNVPISYASTIAR